MVVTNCKDDRAVQDLTVVYASPGRQHESSRMRMVAPTLTLICTLLLAGCATERLAAAAPPGVNLTGEWNFNPNLSDDPSKLLADPDKTPQRTPGSHRGHGGRGGGGMPPMGSPPGSGYTGGRGPKSPYDTGGYTFTPTAAPPSGSRSLRIPSHLSITQKDNSVTIRANMPDGTQAVDEYAAGTKATVPYGHDSTAERSVGWRGPVFVVATKPKKGTAREDDFALDEDGRLIVTTSTQGGRGNGEVKRVFDRVRGAES